MEESGGQTYEVEGVVSIALEHNLKKAGEASSSLIVSSVLLWFSLTSSFPKERTVSRSEESSGDFEAGPRNIPMACRTLSLGTRMLWRYLGR